MCVYKIFFFQISSIFKHEDANSIRKNGIKSGEGGNRKICFVKKEKRSGNECISIRVQANRKQQRRNTTIMHVHVVRKKRHAVQPSVRCCLPAKGTSPKYSSTLSVDMLLSERETLDKDPLDASREPLAGNCSKSSSVSVSMSRDLLL